MTKEEILKEITKTVSEEKDDAKLLVRLYDLNTAYNRLREIEREYKRKCVAVCQ